MDNNSFGVTMTLLSSLGNDVAQRLSAALGETVYLAPKTSSFRAVILRYEGAQASFPWHYDTEHPSCYRALFLYHKEGDIAPLQYLDAEKNLVSYHLEEGDGWVFKGTQTLHRVPRSKDPQAKRYMLGFQFSPEPEKIERHVSICSVLRQATCWRIFWEFLPCFFMCWMVGNSCRAHNPPHSSLPTTTPHLPSGRSGRDSFGGEA